MKTQIKPIPRLIYIFAWLLVMACGAMAQAYEPFNYPVGAAPANGGTGWAGPWTANGSKVAGPGLAYPGLSTAVTPSDALRGRPLLACCKHP